MACGQPGYGSSGMLPPGMLELSEEALQPLLCLQFVALLHAV